MDRCDNHFEVEVKKKLSGKKVEKWFAPFTGLHWQRRRKILFPTCNLKKTRFCSVNLIMTIFVPTVLHSRYC